MANDIEVTLKVKDELTKGMKKVNDVMGEMGDASEEAIKKSMKLGQQMKDIGVSADEMTDDFLELNPELKLYKELTEKAAKETGGLVKEVKESDKESKKFTGSLKQMAKGLIGVSGAYAVGRAAVAFAKDSLAAAAAAGELPPVFDESTKASERLKLAAGKQLGNALEGTVTVMTRVKNSTAANLELTNQIVDAEREGILTTKEANILRAEQNLGMRSHVDVLGELTEKENEYTKAIENQAIVASRGLSGKGALTDEQRQRRRAASRDGPDTRAGRVVRGGEGFGVDVGIGGGIAGQLQQLELFKLGWLDVQENVDKVNQQYLDGTRTIEFTEQSLTKSAVQFKQMEIEAGIFNSEWAAAVALGQELDVTAGAALLMIQTVGKELDILTNKAWIIDVRVNMPAGIGVGGIGSGLSGAQPNALGGGVTAGRTVLVGERGPELFNPGVSGTISPNDQLGGSTAGIESRLDNLAVAISNMGLDIQQSQAEARG